MREGLPKGWIAQPLAEVTTKVGSGATPSGGSVSYSTKGIPLIRSMNVHFNGFEPKGMVFLNWEQATALDNVTVEAEDVLLNITGASIGRVCIAPKEMHGARVNQHVCIIRPKQIVHPSFLRWFLASPDQQAMIMDTEAGATRQALTKAKILEFHIPLPPFPEQRRIVAKLKALLAKVDTSRKRLERIPVILKRFRQAVLAAACEGRLTEDWRDSNPCTESGEQLVLRMLAERKRKWEVKNGQRRLPPLEPMTETDLSAIPDTWTWTNFDHCSWEITVGFVGPMRDRYVPDGTPFLRSQNVRPLRFDPAGLVYIPSNFHQDLSKSVLSGNEILVVRSGANTGDCCVFPPEFGEANCADLVVARPLSGLVPAYGAAYVASPQGQAHLALHETGIAQPHFNIGAMRVKPFSLPPFDEQQEIVKRIQELFSLADNIESRYLKAKAQVDHLTQSILAKAFRGELVPQDPTDEPAEALLVRIRAESTDTPTRRRGRPSAVSTQVPTPEPLPVAPDRAAETETLYRSEARERVDLATLDTDALMSAFRQVLVAQARWDSDEDLLRALVQHFGHQRLGSRTKEILKGHLRAALLRRIALRNPDGTLSLGPRTLDAYTRDELIACIPSVLRKGQTLGRENLMRALLHHLGFQRLTDPAQDALKSALNAAIRRGLLEVVGTKHLRRIG